MDEVCLSQGNFSRRIPKRYFEHGIIRRVRCTSPLWNAPPDEKLFYKKVISVKI